MDIDFANKARFYTVKGSPASEQLKDFIFTYSDQRSTVEKQMQALDSLKQFQAGDSLILAATNKKNQAMNELNGFLKNFLNNASQSTVASFALGRAAQTLPITDFEASLSQLTQKFPQDSNLTDLKKKYESFKAQQEARSSAGSWVGKAAPELVLPDASGKTLRCLPSKESMCWLISGPAGVALAGMKTPMWCLRTINSRTRTLRYWVYRSTKQRTSGWRRSKKISWTGRM